MTMSRAHRHVATFLVLLGCLVALGASVKLLFDTAKLRYNRDVYRMVYNDNLGLLEDIRARSGVQNDSIRALVKRSTNDTNAPYIVVSIADHRLWYKQGHSELFTAPIATASGKELVGGDKGGHWRFETPRGRLVVQSKDENPAWIPPDWHYIEQARKRGIGLIRLERGRAIVAPGGVSYTVRGSEVVKQYPDGRVETLPPPSEGHESIVNGNILIPPFGTRQRRYLTTLGTRRLDLGDGYGIHGTDEPQSIGHSVSHGCIRMYNADIEKLYSMVPVGTPVYIY